MDRAAEELLDGPSTEKSLLAAKIQRLHFFFSLLIPDMSHEERQLLDDAMTRTYAKKDITHNNASLDGPAAPGHYREMPILGDLYETLIESQKTRRMANILNRLVSGSARAFNQQTNVALDNKYIVLDISELTGGLLTVGMFVALDFVRDKTTEDRTLEAEIMEVTHFERGSGLISTNNNNAAVEIKCSQLEKELITTDRRELRKLLTEKVMVAALDAFRLVRYLREHGKPDMTMDEFYARYTTPMPVTRGYPIFTMNTAGEEEACVFLKDGRCSVYPARTYACLLYPFSVGPGERGQDLAWYQCLDASHHFSGGKAQVKDWFYQNFSREDRSM